MADWAVEADDLGRVFEVKKRPAVVALSGVSLRVAPGEVHGLLGPNGAGKTTLVKILSTVLLPSAGGARVMGHDVVAETAAVRPLIGIVIGGDRGLYGRLTARQNLAYWAALYRLAPADGRERSEALLARVGLADRGDDRVQSYSRGMRQRLHLARGLINDPQVLFLDEPSTGMDPVAAREFRAIVRELAAEGRTVFLTTHDMAEAEAVCDRVTLIDRGQVLATESPTALSRLASRNERIECAGAGDGVLERVGALAGVERVTVSADSARIHLETEAAVGEVMRWLVAAGVTSVRVTRPSLEEVYLDMVGDRGMGV
ncbi:MAG TPA: ABC transporter ATP-binding protein [Acidimicrobiales bacterium]|nr:ABC transporter ATP-binding protein [Acidimicrobiales bacterium]